jgi:hypothetical protein
MLHSNMWVVEEEVVAEAESEGVRVEPVVVAVLPVVSLIIPINTRLDMSDIYGSHTCFRGCNKCKYRFLMFQSGILID